MKTTVLPVYQHIASYIREWFSLPAGRALAMLAALLVLSGFSWMAGGPSDEAILYFASPSGLSLQAETRVLPLERGIEKRASLLVSELVLGPGTRSTRPLFAEGTRVESVLFRQGTLFIDLSQEASLSLDPPIHIGMLGLRKTLLAGLPGWYRIVVTVGGMPPLPVNRRKS